MDRKHLYETSIKASVEELLMQDTDTLINL